MIVILLIIIIILILLSISYNLYELNIHQKNILNIGSKMYMFSTSAIFIGERIEYQYSPGEEYELLIQINEDSISIRSPIYQAYNNFQEFIDNWDILIDYDELIVDKIEWSSQHLNN